MNKQWNRGEYGFYESIELGNTSSKINSTVLKNSFHCKSTADGWELYIMGKYGLKEIMNRYYKELAF